MYLEAVYERKKEELRTLLAGKPLAVIFDETPDVEGRCVLNILLAPLEKDHSGRILAYLADTVFLERCNHSTVSVAVVRCLQEYSINNEDVIVFDTNNAAYMKKAFTAALQLLFPNSLHITCMAHIMNLIGNAFCKPFVQLNSFMLRFSQMFFNAGSRKRRYLCFMTNKLPRKKAAMPPNPCATRWNSWFSAVQYHAQHFGLYKEFIEMEIEVCGRSAPQSVERLHQMLQDPENTQEKLTKYMSHGQPAIEFLQEVRVFDPRHIAFLDDSVASYKAIPGFTEVPSDELDSYFKTLGPAALRGATSDVVDLDVFWDGLQERLPVLSSLAKRYKNAVSNQADAERSNSIYKVVLSNRRRSTTNQNLKALVFLYHNQLVHSGAFEREEMVEGEEMDVEGEGMEDEDGE